jgi:methylmalonyl-CoA/ethylmalonyl-CoA epimerase
MAKSLRVTPGVQVCFHEGIGMVVDHVGIVVRSLDDAIARWETFFGYHRLTDPVVNTRQHVRVVFLAKEGSIVVKLIEPIDDSSPVSNFAKRGGGLHHLCFRCDDLPAELARMEILGGRIISEPQPGEAFENEKIAFVYIGDGLNVEIIDSERKAKIIQKTK